MLIGLTPFFEYVLSLHWRPEHVGPVTIDPLLARKHREHHVNPRDVPLIFIPWRAPLWVLPIAVAISLLAFPRLDGFGYACTMIGSPTCTMSKYHAALSGLRLMQP